MSGMQSLIGFFLGNARPSNSDTVVHVKRTVLAVAWLAINQSVSCMSIYEGTAGRLTNNSSNLKKPLFARDRHDFGMDQSLGSSHW